MQNPPHIHPPTLPIFFATEMWERYGFYVVQTLLALYLALHFHWQDKDVYALVGSFTALTYISPVIGGWIADHLLGQKRAILTGAVVLLASYLVLSLLHKDQVLTAALAGIAVGTGLLKPNISSLLGNEYPVGSPSRESGFTIFYMGITTGIILGTTIPSYLHEYFGWSTAFFSAAIGLAIGIVTFTFGIYYYAIQDYHPFEFKFKKILLAVVMMFLLWLVSFYTLNSPQTANTLFLTVVLLTFAYLWYCIATESKTQAYQTMVIALLCIISVMFWAFYFQMFLSLTLFIVRVVQPKFFGISFAPPYYVGIQSFGMILFGLLLSRQKKPLTHLQQTIRSGNKFLLAMLMMLISYSLITLFSHMGSPETLLSPWAIIPAYLIFSLAELLLSPVGLSAMTTLASPKKVSTMMGIFLVSLGIGGFLSGKLAQLTAIPVGETSIAALKSHYTNAFGTLLCILFAATLVCVVINYFIKKLMVKSSVINDR
ncbi:MAG: oligopeptide:H+ symporter [Legionellales bacterium]|nr:oligopeptide:H+ symporter [Legionellales bacterium]